MLSTITGIPLKVAYSDLGYQAPREDRSWAARLSNCPTKVYRRTNRTDSSQVNREVSQGSQNIGNYLGPAIAASRCLTPTTNPSTGNSGVFEINIGDLAQGVRGVLQEFPLHIRQVDSITSDVIHPNELSVRAKYFPDRTEVEYYDGRQRNDCALQNAVELCLFGRV